MLVLMWRLRLHAAACRKGAVDDVLVRWGGWGGWGGWCVGACVSWWVVDGRAGGQRTGGRAGGRVNGWVGGWVG